MPQLVLWRWPWHRKALQRAKVVDLPAGPINHHWTKSIIADEDGKRLCATVGLNSNVAENGLDAEVNRAAILEINLASRTSRLFASGLRNPTGWAGSLDACAMDRGQSG